MSLQECTNALRSNGSTYINAGEFSQAELEAAARVAHEQRARLIISNLKGRTCEEIGRIVGAGGRQISFADIHLL